VNHRIVFVASGNLWEVYSWDPDPAMVERLTATPEPEWVPAWSPDDRHVAVRVSEFPPSVHYTERYISILSVDGGSERRLTSPDQNMEGTLAWRPYVR
jgi:Tol biopolymer transport system component